VVVATAYAFDQSFGYGIGYSSQAELPPNGHADLPVIVRPAADPVTGSTVATVDPGGLSTDGRSLTFRFNLTYVDGSRRRIDYDALIPLLSLEVNLAECVPDGGNDSPMFQSDCVGGSSGFDAAYGVVEPPAPFVFQTSTAAGLPQPYTAALLLDQSKHFQLYDPGDTRLFGTKYFLLQNRVTDHVVLAAFGVNDASSGELSPLPQQPVTIFPVQNGTSSFSTVDSLARLEGGLAPLYAAIDQMLDFLAANEPAVGQRRMVVVVTDGRDETCGTEAECRDAREAVAEKSLATGIELVTIGLAGGALEDRRALSELTAAGRGRSFWVSDRTQLSMLFGALPDVLSYGGEVLEVSFKIQASTAGAFQSGRTVFATVVLEQCFDWYCTNWSIPIAVRIP
jgi:von Willebrand factor type A domain